MAEFGIPHADYSNRNAVGQTARSATGFKNTVMTNRVIAVSTAALLLAGVSAGSAFARGPESVVLPTIEQFAPAPSYNGLTTGPLGGVDGPLFDRCVGDSASEGNANQQNFPVKQYGQTSGGTRC